MNIEHSQLSSWSGFHAHHHKCWGGGEEGGLWLIILKNTVSFSVEWHNSVRARVSKKTFLGNPSCNSNISMFCSFYEQSEYMGRMLRKNTCHLMYCIWRLTNVCCTMAHRLHTRMREKSFFCRCPSCNSNISSLLHFISNLNTWVECWEKIHAVWYITL